MTMKTVDDALTQAREAMDARSGLLDALEERVTLDRTGSGAILLGKRHVGYNDGQDRWVDNLEGYLWGVEAVAGQIAEGKVTERSDIYQALCDATSPLWSQIGSAEYWRSGELQEDVGPADWPEVADFLGLEHEVAEEKEGGAE